MKIALVELSPLVSDSGSSPAPNPPTSESWPLGPRESAQPDSRQIHAAVERCLRLDPDLIAIWDSSLGPPDADRFLAIARTPGDVWHGGLGLGQGARPALLPTVHPTWMLAHDPPAEIEASSWRLSLRACLFRTEIWRQLGGLDLGYRHIDGAALELGHRWLWGGALPRHQPSLLAPGQPPGDGAKDLDPDDEMRFLFQRTSRFWATWALGRALLSRRGASPPRWIAAWKRQSDAKSGMQPHLERGKPFFGSPTAKSQAAPSVTVLIPTLDRYPYLRVVLEHLEVQTIQPLEVIVIDQTTPAKRQRDWHDGTSLHLIVIERDKPGQSSARNAGLVRARGDVILFLDDDIEMEPDLIERHLEILALSGAQASCGVTEEVGAGELPDEFRHFRLSDVFPTCNAALRREALRGSGLFDLAFDHGARADADLGTRVYLSGALMILAPTVSVLHHKAPAGGLRQHKARVATYAASRRSLVRHLPSVTEIYLAHRYGAASAAREMLWQRVLGTLQARGPIGQRMKKLIWGLALLPDTLARVASRSRRARTMLQEYPRIPSLPSADEKNQDGKLP